jgi:hypothetical protein
MFCVFLCTIQQYCLHHTALTDTGGGQLVLLRNDITPEAAETTLAHANKVLSPDAFSVPTNNADADKHSQQRMQLQQLAKDLNASKDLPCVATGIHFHQHYDLHLIMQREHHHNITRVPAGNAARRSNQACPAFPCQLKAVGILETADTQDRTSAMQFFTTIFEAAFPDIALASVDAALPTQLRKPVDIPADGQQPYTSALQWDIVFTLARSEQVPYFCLTHATVPTFQTFTILTGNGAAKGIPAIRFVDNFIGPECLRPEHEATAMISWEASKLAPTQPRFPKQALDDALKQLYGDGAHMHDTVMLLLETSFIIPVKGKRSMHRIIFCNRAAVPILQHLQHFKLCTGGDHGYVITFNFNTSSASPQTTILQYAVGTTALTTSSSLTNEAVVLMLFGKAIRAIDKLLVFNKAAPWSHVGKDFQPEFINNVGERITLAADTLTAHKILSILFTPAGTSMSSLDGSAIQHLTRGRTGCRVMLACANLKTAAYLLMANAKDGVRVANEHMQFNLPPWNPISATPPLEKQMQGLRLPWAPWHCGNNSTSAMIIHPANTLSRPWLTACSQLQQPSKQPQ